jgi:hypothetical protein
MQLCLGEAHTCDCAGAGVSVQGGAIVVMGKREERSLVTKGIGQ